MTDDSLQARIEEAHGRYGQAVHELVEVRLPTATDERFLACFDGFSERGLFVPSVPYWALRLFDVRDGLTASYYHCRNVERLEHEVSEICLRALADPPTELPATTMNFGAPSGLRRAGHPARARPLRRREGGRHARRALLAVLPAADLALAAEGVGDRVRHRGDPARRLREDQRHEPGGGAASGGRAARVLPPEGVEADRRHRGRPGREHRARVRAAVGRCTRGRR